MSGPYYREDDFPQHTELKKLSTEEITQEQAAIPRLCQDLDGKIAKLEKVIEQLLSRVSGVVRNETHLPEKDDKRIPVDPPMPGNSELAQALQGNICRLQQYIEKIQGISRRLEL